MAETVDGGRYKASLGERTIEYDCWGWQTFRSVRYLRRMSEQPTFRRTSHQRTETSLFNHASSSLSSSTFYSAENYFSLMKVYYVPQWTIFESWIRQVGKCDDAGWNRKPLAIRTTLLGLVFVCRANEDDALTFGDSFILLSCIRRRCFYKTRRFQHVFNVIRMPIHNIIIKRQVYINCKSFQTSLKACSGA